MKLILLLTVIHQIVTLPGCGVGDKIEPMISCQNIFDCYNGDENAYLAEMERKFTKWCDKDGGVCCQANNDDHTCPDGITPRFGEDPCTGDTKCENSKKYTGTCSSLRCCPSEHDFETHVKCVEAKPLARIYQMAYCRDGLVQYTAEKSEYKEGDKCATNSDCREAEFCANLKTGEPDRHCIEDPLIPQHGPPPRPATTTKTSPTTLKVAAPSTTQSTPPQASPTPTITSRPIVVNTTTIFTHVGNDTDNNSSGAGLEGGYPDRCDHCGVYRYICRICDLSDNV